MTDLPEGFSDLRAGAVDGTRPAAISWVYGGFRYHVWVNPKTYSMGDGIVYKNPPLGVRYGAPGYFDPRKLKISVKANGDMVRTILDYAREIDLIAATHKAEVEAEAARQAAIKKAQADATRDALEKYLPADLVRALPEDALIHIYIGVRSHRDGVHA